MEFFEKGIYDILNSYFFLYKIKSKLFNSPTSLPYEALILIVLC